MKFNSILRIEPPRRSGTVNDEFLVIAAIRSASLGKVNLIVCASPEKRDEIERLLAKFQKLASEYVEVSRADRYNLIVKPANRQGEK